MEIRYITPTDDRMEISKIYEESWKCAYKGIYPKTIWIRFLMDAGRQP